MTRYSIGNLLAFVAVARESSFTRAAGKLGVSPSALSHSIRALETELEVRLLTRTTRSVGLTDAGERLMENVAPRLQDIEAGLAAVNELSDKPAGTIRITAIDYAIDSVLLPRLAPLLLRHPKINVELSSDYRMVDIVAERYDIGVRWGDQVAKDMIAVPLAPNVKQTIVGAPAYFAMRGVPSTPHELLQHNCIALRLPGGGALYAWELKKGKREMQVRVDGQATFNGAYQMLNAALSGTGLAFLPDDITRPHVDAGRLNSVLVDWCPVFTGLHAYYPSRRQSSQTLGLVIEAIRWQR